MKRNLIVTFCLFLSSALTAQDFSLAGLSYSYYGSSKVTEGNLNNAEIQIEELRAFLNIPIKLKGEGNVMFQGIRYLRVSPENALTTQTDFGDLHRISYRAHLIKSLRNQWTVSVIAEPTLGTSLSVEGLRTDDFIFQSSLVFLKEKSENVRKGFGLSYSTQFGQPIPIPMFIYTRKYLNAKLDLYLPVKASYHWIFDMVEIGPQMSIDGSRFGVDLPVLRSQGLSERIELLDYSRVQVGPSLRMRLSKLLVAEVFVGHTIVRNYRVFDQQDNNESFEMENNFFAQFSLSLKPKADKDE